GVPLRAAVYAAGDASPVLELEATEISYGRVDPSTFAINPPAGAKVVDLAPRHARGARAKPVEGLGAVQGQVPLKLAAPDPVRGLVKRYGDLTAVAGVDLTVEPGDVFGCLGPNGAGKTTLLRMTLGLIRPSAGHVRLFGRDPQLGVAALEGVSGFVEAPRFYPYLSGRANLELLAALDGDGAAGRI